MLLRVLIASGTIQLPAARYIEHMIYARLLKTSQRLCVCEWWVSLNSVSDGGG